MAKNRTMQIGHLLAEARKTHPNAVIREDENGIYFDFEGNEYPEDPIIDVASVVYLYDTP